MARIVENSKNFKILEMFAEEAKSIGFGIPQEGCVCMHCNEIIPESMYYIAVLNDVLCKNCYDKWIESAVHYPEDIDYEERAFEYVQNLLYEASLGNTIQPTYPEVIKL